MTSEDSNNDYYYFDLPIENRLTSPSTILRFYITPITGSLQETFLDEGLELVIYMEPGYTDCTVLSGAINNCLLYTSDAADE